MSSRSIGGGIAAAAALVAMGAIFLTAGGCRKIQSTATSEERSATRGQIAFEDQQPGSGVNFRLSYPTHQDIGIKETVGHPAALFDADGDGRLDILLAGPDRVALFRNLGDWKFSLMPGTGIHEPGYWQGVAIGDVNLDDRPDIFLCGFGCTALYLNRGGFEFEDGTSPSGLGQPPADLWQTSAAMADIDLDGALDLYVTCYVDLAGKRGVCTYPGGVVTACHPGKFAPQRGRLYRNLGRGRFEEVTAAWGLGDAHGNGLGAAFGDPNNDGYPDLYLANDQKPCDLFINEHGRHFSNQGISSGTAYGVNGSVQSGMGIDFGDYDNDGREDIVVANYRGEPRSLYHNDATGLFNNAAYASQIGAASSRTVGWGVKWVDLDNDGLLDLVTANGHPLHRIHDLDPTTEARQPFQVFQNLGGGRFIERLSVGTNLPRPLSGRALCTGDLDNDGRIDLLISDIEGEPLLLRNVTPTSNRWLGLRLAGPGIVEGASVSLRAAGHAWHRRSTTGGSYLAASDPRVHFGCGDLAAVDEIEIRWSGGETSVVKAPSLDRELTVTRSAARFHERGGLFPPQASQ